jgi:putative dimethyl sulfoxide reductase chaperone
VELLQIDYTKLFVGPYGLLTSPYGSAYLEDAKAVMGDSTMDVKKRYREEGLDISLKEAPDHIVIELEFMYFLAFKEIEAIGNSDDGGAARYREKQKAFLDTHLGIWVSEFADNVEANAQTGFYKYLARITKSFVMKDLNRLADNLVGSFR